MTENPLFKQILFVVLALAGPTMLLVSRAKLRNGLLLFILMLGLGYRTWHATEALRIIPGELLLCLLPFLLVVGRSGNPERAIGLPWWVWLLMPFWLLAWLPSPENGSTWDLRLAEFRNFALLIPLFVIVPIVLADRANWRAVILAFSGVSVWLAAMGLVEYLFPGIKNVLPGFIGDPSPIIADGFKRAAFSFYGSPIAVFICVMAMPLSALAWRWWPTPAGRIATGGGIAVQLAAVYISGYRSMWLLVGFQFALFTVVRRQYLPAVLLALLVLVGYQAVPSEALDRLHSLEMVLRGTPEAKDTSGMKRWDRALGALSYALEEPTGHGWAASGWVHSDFIQVAANQGLPAGLLFLGAYLIALGRLGARLGTVLADEARGLGVALFLSFIAVGGILLYEGVEFLPQTVLPVWLVWALVETWLQQTALSPPPRVTGSLAARAPLLAPALSCSADTLKSLVPSGGQR